MCVSIFSATTSLDDVKVNWRFCQKREVKNWKAATSRAHTQNEAEFRDNDRTLINFAQSTGENDWDNGNRQRVCVCVYRRRLFTWKMNADRTRSPKVKVNNDAEALMTTTVNWLTEREREWVQNQYHDSDNNLIEFIEGNSAKSSQRLCYCCFCRGCCCCWCMCFLWDEHAAHARWKCQIKICHNC